MAGAAASIFGASQQASAANKAANMQEAQYDQTRSDLAPYRTAGANATNLLTAALPSLAAPITMSEADLEATPGFKFTLAQGLKSVQNSAAARGLGTSGAALKGAASYATGLADSTYNQQFQNANTNKLNSYNFLTGTAGLGAGAANQTGQLGQQAAANSGNALIAGSSAQAAGLTGAANALTGGVNSYLGYQLSQQQNQYPNQLLYGSYGPNGYTPGATMYRAPLQLGYQAGV